MAFRIVFFAFFLVACQLGAVGPGASDNEDDGITTVEASLGGQVWRDWNGNGVKDPEDQGVGGFVAFLDANGNGQLDDGETSAVSNANGIYEFAQAQAGQTVNVVVQMPLGWTRTATEITDNKSLGLAHQIVGGQTAALSELPWMVSLRTGGNHSCGGSLIAPDTVLTAAHCIGPTYVAHIGAERLDQTGQAIAIAQTIVHPNYNPNTNQNDVALLKLAQPANGSRVFLVEGSTAYDNAAVATVAGWGRITDGGPISNQLLKVDVPIVSNQQCQAAYPNENIDGGMICAGVLGQGGKDSCQGDSGGPQMVKADDGTYYQVGVVSWGYGCAEAQYPGVYARVSTYWEFIRKNVTMPAPASQVVQVGSDTKVVSVGAFH